MGDLAEDNGVRRHVKTTRRRRVPEDNGQPRKIDSRAQGSWKSFRTISSEIPTLLFPTI
jgi:hypothetical protein